MFGGIGLTEYDLQFSIYGIPVRVTPWFWLVSVLMGRGLLEEGKLDFLFIWVACLFFSILIHELGHAIVANYFGWPPQIVLYHFGGLAMFQPYHGYTTFRSVFVSFAGPLAGFLLFGGVMAIIVGLMLAAVQFTDYMHFAVENLIMINLFWGAVNLVPVLPLDGGRISQALLERFRPRDGYEISLKIGMAASVITAFLFAQWLGFSFPSILFAMLFIQNLQMYQQLRGGGW